MKQVLRTLLILAAVSAAFPGTKAIAAPGPQPMYFVLADSVQGSLDEATAALRSAFTARGWQVLAVHDVAVDRAACAYRARVLILNDPNYAALVMDRGPRAAFALPPRLLLFEDEEGLHLATVNPLSLNRTIIAENGFEAVSEALIRNLSTTAAEALRGHFVRRGYGKVRDKGMIGKTMGIMAGGPFPEKIHELHASPGSSPDDVKRVADAAWKGIEQGGARGRWQIRGVYRLDLSARGVVILGVSGDAMEAKSYSIVGAGADEHRSKFKCPGIAHAAAYPIELVVYADQGQVHVGVVEGMYRMKVFFEDAGKMKFASNMGMPGSIEDEIRGLVQAGFPEAK
jgi:uncharacterized protein (DUF302 family)